MRWVQWAIRVVPLTLMLLLRPTLPFPLPDEARVLETLANAEKLRRNGNPREAYRILYSLDEVPAGRTGAAVLNLTGSVLQDLGRLGEAEDRYRRVIRLLEREFGRDDRGLLVPLNNLGGLMLARGRPKEAAQLRERSLELRRRYYSETDPVVLRGLENLAAVCLALKQYTEAERLFESARLGWENENSGSPKAVIALNGLGLVAQSKGQTAEAIALFRDAIHRWPPGEEPLLLAIVQGNLAGVLPPDEAVAQYAQAMAVVEKHAGAEHPILAPLLEGQARCLRALNRKGEARESALRASRIRKSGRPMTVDVSALQ